MAYKFASFEELSKEQEDSESNTIGKEAYFEIKAGSEQFLMAKALMEKMDFSM